MKRTLATAGFAAVLAGAPGCASVSDFRPKPGTASLPALEATPAPAGPDTSEQGAPAGETAAPEARLIYYRGVSGSLATAVREDDRLAGRIVSLNFNNAPAADVARAVLAEALGQPLTIADGVSGTVTLSAPDPVPAADALAALEAALAESDLTLLRTRTGFLLTSVANAARRAQPLQNNRAGFVGYGVTIVPVRNAAPGDLVQLIDPFISDRVTVTVDEARGAILLRGAQSEVESAVEAIGAFDTPWLTDRVFGMFRLRFAGAETLRQEIATVLQASGGGARAELIALPRLNLLFVSSRTREGFNEARGWIERLDQPSGGDERRLRYYAVKNTPAEVLAAQLNAAFGGHGSDTAAAAAPAGARENGAAVQPTFRRTAPAAGGFGGDGATISTDKLNNALIIRATDQEYREILGLIAHMDVLSPQVLIEATIAEVTLNEDLAYGVRWFFENAESTVSFPGFVPDGAFRPIIPGLNYSIVDGNVSVALDALASITDVTVLSAPSIMVLNNRPANLQVGDEVPIITQQAQSVVDIDAPIVSTVQLRDTGVILEIKPRINASDVVVLEITQEVSDVAPTTTSGIDSPTIQQRRFTSTVAVKNNSTIALGGLIRETYTDNESGVPILKDLPILGNVFKSRAISKRRTELIIFLTPHIIRNDEEARRAIRFIRRQMERLGEQGALTQ